MSTESHVAGLVREYLDTMGYTEASNAFHKEHLGKGFSFSSIPALPFSPKQSTETIKESLLHFFDTGERGNFFNVWDRHLPDSIRLSDDALRIEFYTSIHFAVFPVHRHVDPTVMKLPLSSTLETFKAFLETRGVHLSKTPEFLPYYALPYLPDPSAHPTFVNVFAKEWLVDLRRKLSDFIDRHIRITVTPHLVEIVQGQEECKRKETQLLKKHQILQADYHNLLSITSELVGTLASSLNGQQVNPEYIARILERLQIFRKGSGTACKDSPDYLRFDKIKLELSQSDPKDARIIVHLLHALRMRVTQQPTSQQKRAVIKTYIEYDLLGLGSKQPLIFLLAHPHEAVTEQTAKLLNLMTCFSCGRTYLAMCEAPLIDILVETVKNVEKHSASFFHHTIGILEKMSLRRSVRSQLISLDMVRHCVKLLGHIESLVDATLAYVCALLMNLTVPKEGRKRAAEVGDSLLAALCELLENDDPMVRAYAHGVCFSILDDPFFKDKANAIGLHELLRYLKENAPPPIAKQIDFVLGRLQQDSVAEPKWETDSDDGEEGDFEEEVEEEDYNEELDPIQELGLSPDESYGDAILRRYEAPDGRSQGKGGFKPTARSLINKLGTSPAVHARASLCRPPSSLRHVLPPVARATKVPSPTIPTSGSPNLSEMKVPPTPLMEDSSLSMQVQTQRVIPPEKVLKSPKTRLHLLGKELLEYEDIFKPRPRLAQTPPTQVAR